MGEQDSYDEDIATSSLHSVALAEMRNTEGFAIWLGIVKDKYAASARALVTDASMDIDKIISNRARCKLIIEILAATEMSKEELKWNKLT